MALYLKLLETEHVLRLASVRSATAVNTQPATFELFFRFRFPDQNFLCISRNSLLGTRQTHYP
jgi:hypothetical protein